MKPVFEFHASAALPAPRGWPRALIALLGLGLAARLMTLAVPGYHHPDEIYQYLEAAHRLVFGYGAVPWEYRVGMRGWLYPLLIAAPMRLGEWIAPGGSLYLLLPRIVMVLASTSVIVSAWMLGARVSRRHAIMAALVATCWYELIAFAAHPIGEAAGLAAALGGAALIFGPAPRARGMMMAGALLALAGIIRFQYGPALAVLALAGAGRDWRGRWQPMIIGGAAMLALSSAVDVAMGGVPFGWLAENVRQNMLLHKADGFGTAGPLTYLGVLGTAWRWGTVPIVIAAYAGMKRQPALFWAAVIHLGFHSLIGHKEYRFILLTDAIAVILAGIGTIDLADALGRRLGDRWRETALATLVSLWIIGSALLGGLWWNRPLWTAHAAAMKTVSDIRGQPGLCGVAVLGLPISELGGYTALNRDVPIYILDGAGPGYRATAARLGDAYNALITTPDRNRSVPPGFVARGCRSTRGEYVGTYADPKEVARISAVCRFERRGPCDQGAQHQAAPTEINATLIAYGM